jgi:hypothetical protein
VEGPKGEGVNLTIGSIVSGTKRQIAFSQHGRYARGDAMAERKKMAQWWADYLDRLRDNSSNGTNVVQMSKL